MPELHRIIWASDEARKVWEPRIAAISSVWRIIEYESVFHGLRSSALIYLSGDDFINLSRKHFNKANIVPIANDLKLGYRVLVTKEDPRFFMDAWDKQDNVSIGKQLGFPTCCTEFFEKYWSLGYRDLTHFQCQDKDDFAYDDWFDFCNVMLRSLGVRGVFHLPCSFDCEATIALGDKNFSLIQKLGYENEVRWAGELLYTSTEYTAMHGISETVTPAFKIIQNTDYTRDKKTIWLHGDSLEAGVKGKQFPHNVSSYRDQPEVEEREDIWTANGFSSYEAMEYNHQFILALAKLVDYTYVLDLGCGNGELLRKLSKLLGTTIGVDKDRKNPNGNIYQSEVEPFLQEHTQGYDLILIAEQRLQEAKDPFAMLDKIYNLAKWVIIYNYDGLKDYRNALELGRNEKAVLVPCGN